MHVVSIDQFDTKLLKEIFDQADNFQKLLDDKDSKKKLSEKHSGKQICTLFYEPSTRTRLSFETAALKLGIGVVSTESAGQFSSASKGETIEDTMQVLNQYGFDAIIIRHPETGAVKRAANVSQTPVINAGDGKGEHPTQALLDAYTIRKEFGRLDNLRIVMGGDLKYGRTVRSLARLLSQYPNNHIIFVSIPKLMMDQDIKNLLTSSGTTFEESTNLEQALSDSNVVYWTRLQKERLEKPGDFDSAGFDLIKESIKNLPLDAIILHPLPRVDEIAVEIDSDPRAKYFQQAGNGLYIRMALLDKIAGES
ncbi:aspartate carbamoyltransferase [Candidatus Parcubacteria bacterium]|nr:aspartate carbamoyltransferase [Candidatus Parcubacteria bacterium]